MVADPDRILSLIRALLAQGEVFVNQPSHGFSNCQLKVQKILIQEYANISLKNIVSTLSGSDFSNAAGAGRVEVMKYLHSLGVRWIGREALLRAAAYASLTKKLP